MTETIIRIDELELQYARLSEAEMLRARGIHPATPYERIDVHGGTVRTYTIPPRLRERPSWSSM
jgi:hypothetical protein